MEYYARIVSGVVAEVVTLPDGETPTGYFAPAIASTFVLVPAGVTAAQGWTESGGVFTAPVAPTLTLAQQAKALLAGGLTITSTATPTLTAVYPADAASQRKLLAVNAVVQATGAFPGGGTTWSIKDVGGAWHTVTVAQFAAIALAIASFVAPIDLIVDGHTGITMPPASVSIA